MRERERELSIKGYKTSAIILKKLEGIDHGYIYRHKYNIEIFPYKVDNYFLIILWQLNLLNDLYEQL